ncbi:MAG: CHASE2 domain-containing protein [Candidatus Gracilibacteria bacterium]|nr:CHASE2 domain-containing protein [Candidatus Gracilibacteria bacterium]
MLNKLLKNNIFLTFFISIIVFGIIYLFSIYLINIDKSLSDKLYSNYIGENVKISDKIIIVEIDDESIEKIGNFPFSRTEYIPIIENLTKAGAPVIGMDIIFADKSTDKVDEKFAETLKKAGNVIIGGGIINKNNKDSFQKPYYLFEKAVFNYGYFQPIYNKDNKKVYSLNAYGDYDNGKIFHFGIQVLRGYLSNIYSKDFTNYFKEDKNSFYINNDIKIPAKNGKEININFRAEKNPLNFKKFSFYKLSDKNFYKQFPKKYFEDKIIIIGYTAKGLKDIFISPEGQKFGVYTHANIINTIITKQYKIYFYKNVEYLLIFFLIILSVYFNLISKMKIFINK